MNITKCTSLFFSLITILFGVQSCSQKAPLPHITTITEMKGFPSNANGFEQGVSAPFVGNIGDKIILAGGCNFPDIPASEGGEKRFYSDIYLSEPASQDTALAWKKVGELPQPMAYGVSISLPSSLLCIGGNNTIGPNHKVIELHLVNDTVQLRYLPDLPQGIDNMSGCLLDSVIYIVGGNVNGMPSSQVYALDLRQIVKGWQMLPTLPGPPRIQSVCVALKDEFGNSQLLVWGGFAPRTTHREPSLSVDGYAYQIADKEWKHLDAPHLSDGTPISLGGAVAIPLSDSIAVFMGGVNKDIFLQALTNPIEDYLLQPVEWYQFNPFVLSYNAVYRKWHVMDKTSWSARAGAGVVMCNDDIYYINGELKPGIRTNAITRIRIQ